MPVKKTLSEVQELLKAKRSPLKKPILFSAEIDDLKKGQGLHIANNEWPLKTSMSAYYNSKYNKNEKIVKCFKVDDGYIVEKL